VVGYALESPHKKTYKKKFTNAFYGNNLKWTKVYTQNGVIETESMIGFMIQTEDDSLYMLSGNELTIETAEGEETSYISAAGYSDRGSFLSNSDDKEWYLQDIKSIEYRYFDYEDDWDPRTGPEKKVVHIEQEEIEGLYLGFIGRYPGMESLNKEMIPIEDVEKVVFKTHTIGKGTMMLMGVGFATDLIVGTIWLISLAF
jgi:hypothetical protein